MGSFAKAGSPWPIGALVERMHRDGIEALGAELGRFVLVGSGHADDEPGGWSFATQTVRAALARRATTPFDIETSKVHPLVKRSSRFARTILIGRASSNDVCIDDVTISKLHARVRLDERCFWLEDASSRNGTFVEGERVRATLAVYPGETLRFGNCTFRVHDTTRFLDVLRRMSAP